MLIKEYKDIKFIGIINIYKLFNLYNDIGQKANTTMESGYHYKNSS